MRGLLSTLAAALNVACGSAAPSFIAWPDLQADDLVFLVTRDTASVRAIHGPHFGGDPRARLEIESPESAYLLALDREWLLARHPRVDPDALLETRLVEPLAECARCGGTCRVESDSKLYHRLGEAGRTWILSEDQFVPTEDEPLAALTVELPARWTCAEQVATQPLERAYRWDTERDITRFINLPDGRRLGTATRAIYTMASTENLVWTAPSGDILRSVTELGTPGRLLVTTSELIDSEAGRVFLLDSSGESFSTLREFQTPSAPVGVFGETRGVTIVGSGGHVWTSTAGTNLSTTRLTFGIRLRQVARVDAWKAPYLIGGNSGKLVWGDPWSTEPAWEADQVASTDSSVEQFHVLESSAEHPREIWAKTAERGLYFVRSDGIDGWQKVTTEMPRTFPGCARAIDECGFTTVAERTLHTLENGRSLLLLARNCPVLSVVHPDDGCASTVELRLEDGLAMEGRGLFLDGDSVLVIVSDGAVRVPLSGL